MCKLIQNSLRLRRCFIFKGRKPFGQRCSSVPSFYIPTAELLRAYLGGLISGVPPGYLRGRCAKAESTAAWTQEARSRSSSDNSCSDLGKSLNFSPYPLI